MSDAAPDAANNPAVLIVEDDVELAEELAAVLADYGMEGSTADSWDRALALVAQAPPDLIVLDQRLGRIDAVARLGELRKLTDAPVLVLTGNKAEADRIVALEIGADDFLTKPISGRELVARIRANLRRASRGGRTASPGAWEVLQAQRALKRPDGSLVELTGAEFDLLNLLMAAQGEAVDRETLTQRVLHRPWRFGDRALDNLVLHLRKKFGPGGARTIAALRNYGYCFAGFPDS